MNRILCAMLFILSTSAATACHGEVLDGGARASSGGEPIMIASGQDACTIALGAEEVFWANCFGGGAIAKAPKAGGPTTVLAESDGIPNTIAVDTTRVYWTDAASNLDEGKIKSVPLAGGDVTTIASGQSDVQGVAIDTANVYWTGRGVVRAPLAGGPPVVLAVAEYAHDIVVDDEFVYWIGDNELRRTPIAGGATVTLAPVDRPSYGQGLAVDADAIYVTTNNGVARLPKSGGMLEPLTTNEGMGWTLALDETDVYWVQRWANPVYRTPKQGQGVTLIASGSHATAIAVDEANVYWSNADTATQSWELDGTILRIAK